MAAYLVNRIIIGALDYIAVTNLYPQFKAEIDELLLSRNREDLIVE